MDSITTFIHNKVEYVLLDDIKTKDINKAFFIGCKSVRKCVEKHNIPDDKVLYMKNDKIYTKNYKSADVYVEKKYAKDNIMNTDVFKKKKEEEVNEKKKKKEEANKEQVLEKNNSKKQYNDEDIEDEPSIVHLEDNEMFQNENGKPMDITVRGEKTKKGAYFNAYDIGKAFEYERIKSIVLNNGSDYVYGKEYIYFHSTDINYAGRSTGGISSGLSEQPVIKKKVLYLTYMGVLKALFCARGDKADRFLDWAISFQETTRI